MSHGGGEDSIEPDLTPLLDLVMQLLMFFIINVNFKNDATDVDTELPVVNSARPEDNDDFAIHLDLRTLKGYRGRVNRYKLPGAPGDDTLSLKRQFPLDAGEGRQVNVFDLMKGQDSYVKYSGAISPLETYKTQLATKGWLTEKFRDIRSKGGKAVDKDGKVLTTIHIRPDGDLELAELFKLMSFVKSANFRKIKVHALMGS